MEPTNVLTIIHNKMDHLKTTFLYFFHKNKAIDSFMKLLVAVMGLIAHGHGDFQYAHYGLDTYPCDSNHTIGSSTKLLGNFESLSKYLSCQLFVGGETSSLFYTLFHGTNVCEGSFPPPPKSLVLGAPLLPLFNIQLDN
jgi:hypothetical protein